MHRSDGVDLIVVGAGLAGLTAATFAARAGLRVVVVERSDQVGGGARSSERQGFRLNLGPRALYAPAARILDELNVPLAGGNPSLTGYALAGGRLYPMPQGPTALLGMPPLENASGAAATRALVALLAADGTTIEHTSLADWLAAQPVDDRARQFVSSLVRLASYVDAPDLISAAVAQGHLRETAGPVRYLDGGWQTLVDALLRLATQHGVQIRRRARAVAVARDSRGVEGITLADGATLAAESVVLAVNPEAARSMLAGEGATIAPTLPVHAAVLDLALRELPDPNGGFILSLDQPLYLSVHSLAARLAPDDGAVVHLARYLHPGEPAPAAGQLRTELESLMDLVQPGWRRVVVHERFLPAMTVMHALPTAQGGGIHGRPAVAVDGVPGVYLAGDWVGDQHLLAGAALASARRAALLAWQQQTARPDAVGV